MKHTAGSGLNMNDFVIRSRSFELCINYLFFSLCRLYVIFLTLYCRNFLKTVASSKFFLQEEEHDEERLMWMSLVRSNLSCKPEKKGFNKKIFFSCCSVHVL